MDNTDTWHWLSNDGRGGAGTLKDLYVLWKSGASVSNGVAWAEGSPEVVNVTDLFEQLDMEEEGGNDGQEVVGEAGVEEMGEDGEAAIKFNFNYHYDKKLNLS